MDPFTHAVLGAIAGVGLSRIHRRRARTRQFAQRQPHQQVMPLGLAAAVGALAGLFPDIDIVTYPFNPLHYDAYWHRTYTHSVVLAPLWAFALGAALHALARRVNLPHFGFALTYVICLAGILTHIVADVITAWAVGVLLPLSSMRLSLGWIFVIDPIFTLTLMLLLAALYYNWNRNLSILVGCLPALWLSFAVVQKQQALTMAQALQNDMVDDYVAAWPQPLSVFNWKLIRQDNDGIWSAHVRTTERAPIQWPLAWLQRSAEAFQPEGKAQWRHHPQYPSVRAEIAWRQPAFTPARTFITYPVYLRKDAEGCHWFTDWLFVIPTQEPPFQYAACETTDGDWEVKRGDVSMPWQS